MYQKEMTTSSGQVVALKINVDFAVRKKKNLMAAFCQNSSGLWTSRLESINSTIGEASVLNLLSMSLHNIICTTYSGFSARLVGPV